MDPSNITYEGSLELFELDSDYTEEELTKKFRALSLKTNTDKHNAADKETWQKLHEKQIIINLAYAFLLGKLGISGLKYSTAFKNFSNYINTLMNNQYIRVVLNEIIRKTSPSHKNIKTPFPNEIQKRIKYSLYSHQAEAIDHARNGKNVVIVTPTASGKSDVYMLPFLEAVYKDPKSTAIFIYPMKALANDQLEKLQKLGKGLLTVAKYDGDVDKEEKARIRLAPPNVLFTNPDMIHYSILNTYQQWTDFLKNLKYIVLDDVHVYKGYFGSNVANILFRLQKVIKKAGGSPQYICTTATINDPLKFVEKLTGKNFVTVSKSGAGNPLRHYVMIESLTEKKTGYPIINSVDLLANIAIELADNGKQIIVFCSSRIEVDLLTYLTRLMVENRSKFQKNPGNLPARPPYIISGYHAGYNRDSRKQTEQDINSGRTKIIYTTNALELGIDIGTLDGCIIYGIPAAKNDLWQRIGRAGRDPQKPTLVLSINMLSPFDRYYYANPHEFLMTKNDPEQPIINPMNPELRQLHLNCGFFEGLKKSDITDIDNWKQINKKINKWWAYQRISIRGNFPDPYTLFDENNNKIGEIEHDRVYKDLHYGAIFQYFQNGEKYFKRKSIDRKEHQVVLREIQKPDYFTYPVIDVTIDVDSKKVTENILTYGKQELIIGYGSVDVNKKVVAYKSRNVDGPYVQETRKINFPDDWPPYSTQAFWMTVPPGKMNDWDTIIPDFSSRKGHEILHTLVHLIWKAFVNKGHCDWVDLGGISYDYHSFHNNPVGILWDYCKHGIGLSETLFDEFNDLIKDAYNIIDKCPCSKKCPACILTPTYCYEDHWYIDKDATATFLEYLLRINPSSTGYIRNTDDIKGLPPAERKSYKVGGKYEGKIIREITDDGLTVHDPEISTDYFVPYEDTPF